MTALIVYLAGVPWDGAVGTDRRLVLSLSASVRVLWVDPPVSALGRPRGGLRGPCAARGARIDAVAHRIERLRVTGPPLITRVGVRALTRGILGSRVRAAARARGGADVVVVANPLLGFPLLDGAQCVYYVTDDWPAGASLMGLSRPAITRLERANAKRAHVVAAVSPSLADRLSREHGIPVSVLANGCTVGDATEAVELGLPDPVVGLAGQINERLDLELLQAVADRGLSLALVGPRREREPTFARQLDELLARPNVRWLGPRPSSSLPGLLARFRVGVTPYALSDFNKASFPIKTLDYLAAGLPCVATPSPALDWLDTDLVSVADRPQTFADAVERWAHADVDPDDVERRVAFARGHSWDARAAQFLASVGLAAAPGSADSNSVTTTPQQRKS